MFTKKDKYFMLGLVHQIMATMFSLVDDVLMCLILAGVSSFFYYVSWDKGES